MIRVLHVMGTLNCGGAENFIMNIYRNIDRTKLQFDFVVHTEEHCYFEDAIKKLGGRIYRAPKYKVYNMFKYQHWWNVFFREHNEYKIVHCHIRSVAAIILKIAKKYNKYTISHSHSTSNGSGIKSFIKNKLHKKIPKYADYLFACSLESGEWLFGKENIKKDKFYIINNSIDVDKYKYNKEIRDKYRKKMNLDKEIAVVQIGRFNREKNHFFSIELAKELKKNKFNFKMFFIGDGQLRDNIKKKINEENLEQQICILGLRNDVPMLLQAMDIFIMPSLYEGLPLALVEAQAASLPCVISNTIRSGILNNNLVKALSLEDDLYIWNKTVNYYSRKTRCDESDIIVKNGFDIIENVNWMQNFYIQLNN